MGWPRGCSRWPGCPTRWARSSAGPRGQRAGRDAGPGPAGRDLHDLRGAPQRHRRRRRHLRQERQRRDPARRQGRRPVQRRDRRRPARQAAGSGLPEDVVQLVPDDDREAVDTVRRRGLRRPGHPARRRGPDPSVVDGVDDARDRDRIGNCHVYVDATADLEMAVAHRRQRQDPATGVCNAAETLLVHRAVADEFLPRVFEALLRHGVELRGDADVAAHRRRAKSRPPTSDWDTEYLGLDPRRRRGRRRWTRRSSTSARTAASTPTRS